MTTKKARPDFTEQAYDLYQLLDVANQHGTPKTRGSAHLAYLFKLTVINHQRTVKAP